MFSLAVGSPTNPRDEFGRAFIRRIARAGAKRYTDGIEAFSSWLGENPHSFYIAAITISRTKTGRDPYQYQLAISSPQYTTAILDFAKQFDSALGVAATPAETPLYLDGRHTRWAEWFPPRSTSGYSDPDPIGEFARHLLKDVDGIINVETHDYFNIQVFAKPDVARNEEVVLFIKEKLRGLPGTVTVRSDIGNGQLHEQLLDRTTPSLLEAIRIRPNDQIDVALDIWPNELTTTNSLKAIENMDEVTSHSFHSEFYKGLERRFGTRIYLSLPAKSVLNFIGFYGIKKVLLVPDDLQINSEDF